MPLGQARVEESPGRCKRSAGAIPFGVNLDNIFNHSAKPDLFLKDKGCGLSVASSTSTIVLTHIAELRSYGTNPLMNVSSYI